MSSERLSWFFELQEKLSGPAGKAGAAMEKLERNTHKAGGALERLHDIVEIAYEGPQIFAEAWDRASDVVTDALDDIRFKSNALLSLGAMTGSAEKARAIWEDAEDFAYKTGESVENVMRVTKDLVNAGFAIDEVNTLRLMLQDLRVVDPGKAEAVGTVLGEIGRRGYMTSRAMITLSNAGIDETKMWKALSAELGISAEKLRSMEGIKIRRGTAASAVLTVATQKLGETGKLAEAQAKTLPGLISRLSQIPDRIMDAIVDFDETGGGNSKLGRILENIIEAFDPKGATGQRILTKVGEFAQALGEALGLGGDFFDDLAGPHGVEKVEQAMKKMLDWLRRDFIPALQAIGETVTTIGKAASYMAGVVNGGNVWDVGEKIDRAMVAAGAAGSDEARAALGKDQQFRDLALAGDLDEIKRRYSSGRPLNVDAVRAWGAQSSLNVTVNVNHPRSAEDGRRAGQEAGRAFAREMELQGVGQGGSGGGQ